MTKFKLGIDGAFTMNCGLEEEIVILSELGFDGIEIRDFKLEKYLSGHTTGDLSTLLRKKRLSPLCMSAIELKATDCEAERKLILRNAEWLLKAGFEIGCKRAIAAHLPSGTKPLSPEETIDWVAEDLLDISDMAEKYSIDICYEFLGSTQCPIHNIKDTLAVLAKVNRRNMGWLFDIYHFHLTDGSLASLEKADASKLFLVHLADVKNLPFEKLYVPQSCRAMPGEGVADTKRILKALRNMGYAGPFVVELFDQKYMSWDAKDFALTAKKHACKVLHDYFV